MIPHPTPRPIDGGTDGRWVAMDAPVIVTSSTATTVPIPTGMGTTGIHVDYIQMADVPPPYHWGVIIALVLAIAYVWGLGAVLLFAVGEKYATGGNWKIWIWPLMPFWVIFCPDRK